MIAAVSRFKVVNSTADNVREAFRVRPGLVDRVPGFLGIEVYTDQDDDTVFYLVTRWTDTASFTLWHNSEAHREAHRLIPKGLKLDPKWTRIRQLNRIPDRINEESGEERVRDHAVVFAHALNASSILHCAVTDRDGTIVWMNRAFERSLRRPIGELVGKSIVDHLTEPDAKAFLDLSRAGRRTFDELRRKNFVDADRHAFTLDCYFDVQTELVVLVGEPATEVDSRAQELLLQVSNDHAMLSRELTKRSRELEEAKRALEQALEELQTKTWHLKRIQEYLPICYSCHRVRPSDDGENSWMTLVKYLSENSVDFTHGLCPDCYEKEVAKLKDNSLEPQS